ncbi:MAG: proline--tRNA ligase [Nitrosomonadales bacterium]
MKASQFYISTLKEPPVDAEIISHQLMIRGGLIKKLSSGLYSWMPIGLKVLKKIEKIIREEMNKAGAIELLMPAIQPAELWEETGRWNKFGPQMLKIKDRHERSFCFGPTHEEVITDIVRNEISSYKQLPINLYQIQTKFRDEIRPRFGVMRAREFLMKDAYSFHANQDCLSKTYEIMFETYSNIFERIGLKYRAVSADSGAIGGDASHEFHVLAESGEDAIAFSSGSNYAANIELATTNFANKISKIEKLKTDKVKTENLKTIDELIKFFSCNADDIVKAVVLKDMEKNLYVIFLSGEREVNQIKAQKIIGVEELFLAHDEDLKNTELVPGFIGPDLKSQSIQKFFDHSLQDKINFICGANEKDFHLKNANLADDVVFDDLSYVKEGDPSPDGKGTLSICRGIEVGHIFQLGKKYSNAMNAKFLNENGTSEILTMGCYGIGVSRIVASAIEQNHDENGMIFPKNIAPFEVVIIPIGFLKSDTVKKTSLDLYEKLVTSGIDVLLDDRDMRPGVMFAESDLIGIPYRIVIGQKSLETNQVEFKIRGESEAKNIDLSNLIEELQNILMKSSN